MAKKHPHAVPMTADEYTDLIATLREMPDPSPPNPDAPTEQAYRFLKSEGITALCELSQSELCPPQSRVAALRILAQIAGLMSARGFE